MKTSIKKINPQIKNILILATLVTLLITAITITYIYTKPLDKQAAQIQTQEENKIPQTHGIPEEQTSTENIPPTQQETVKRTDTPTQQQTNPTTTAPETPSAYIAFYADTQSDTDTEDNNHQKVVNYILATGANPIFHAGDLMEDGTQDSLNRFNTVTTTLRTTRTFYAALGNNDRIVGDSSTPSQIFLDNFTFPNNEKWYSVNYGNLHMVILDSAFSASNQTQISWLISDLQSTNSQNRITGVMFHHPTFISTISQYLIDYGADFVISGHTHTYTQTIFNGIPQIVLSGQPSIGYITAKIYADKVEMTVRNNNNTIIDNIQIQER